MNSAKMPAKSKIDSCAKIRERDRKAIAIMKAENIGFVEAWTKVLDQEEER